jgi:hypothetical protein
VLYLRLCLLLSEDVVPVIPVGTGDRLMFFASAIVGRRVPLQFGAPLAWGPAALGVDSLFVVLLSLAIVFPDLLRVAVDRVENGKSYSKHSGGNQASTPIRPE